MKPFSLLLAAAFAFSACASASGQNVGAPAPDRTSSQAEALAPAAAARAASVPRATVSEAPADWQLMDAQEDGLAGISLRRAERELLAGRQPRRTVVVAVIDGGVDTAHTDLRPFLWSNAREVGGTGRDDDGNGYADDLRGWNFIGGAAGRSVHHDTYEVAREHALCSTGAPPSPTGLVRDAAHCGRVARDLARERQEAEQTLVQIRELSAALNFVTPILQRAVGADSVTPERVRALRPLNAEVREAQRIYVQLADHNITPAVLEEAREEFASRLEYKLNPSFDPRSIVGDEYKNFTQRHYGNADVMGPDASHGSHVAGIIAGMHRNRQVDGTPAVRIMGLRAVPDGDERDKDVANAIRYAVDNGAHIINMSFGKSYSPHKAIVDEAVRYAEERGVLLVHAAGNDGHDLATNENYPSRRYTGGGMASLWIEVGASSWKGADSLVAPFSNYGREHVDVFAPGVDITSAVPGGGRKPQSGTSMAAPVVSGLAALLMTYHPELTAADVRRIILESATRYADQQVLPPGESRRRVAFGTLSVTGGIVNAFDAVRMAEGR